MYPISMDELHPSVPSDWHAGLASDPAPVGGPAKWWRRWTKDRLGMSPGHHVCQKGGGWSVNRKRDNRYGVPGD